MSATDITGDGPLESVLQLHGQLKELRHIVAASSELNRRLLEAIPGGIVQVDSEGGLTYANPDAQRFLGIRYDEVRQILVSDYRYRTIYEDGSICPVDDYPVSRCLATGQLHGPLTIGVVRPDGEVGWAVFRAAPIFGETGGLDGAVVTFLDITERLRAQRRLIESEERYRLLVESAPDAIIVHHQRRIVFVNQAAVELWKRSREVLMGLDVMVLVHPDFREQVRQRIGRILDHRETGELMQQVHLRGDGSLVDVEVSGSRCIYNGLPCVQTIVRDISARRLIERSYLTSESRFQALCDAAPIGVFEADAQGRVVYCNPHWIRLSGITEKGTLGNRWKDAICEEDRPSVDRLWEQMVQRQTLRMLEFRLQRTDAEVTWVRAQPSVIHDGPRSVAGFVVTIEDVTQRRLYEDKLHRSHFELTAAVDERTRELQRSNDALQQEIVVRTQVELQLQEEQRFLRQLIAAQERDRRLTAYEIHDSFVQDVVAAKMFLESYDAQLEEVVTPDRKLLVDAQRLLRRAVDEARALISGLRPPILDEQGIVGAIEFLVAEHRREGRIVDFSHTEWTTRFPSIIESSVFRIAQEALANWARHSGTMECSVELEHFDGRLKMRIEDSGRGFSPNALPEGRYGLRGIRERAKLLGGSANVTSAPGEGTTIVVDLPASEDRES